MSVIVSVCLCACDCVCVSVRLWQHVRQRMLNEADVAELARGRYAFINVWRSIAEAPVERLPLAVCDEVGG